MNTTDTKKETLPPEQFIELLNFTVLGLERSGQFIDRVIITNALFSFGDKFSLPSMYRFKKWMEENGYSDDDILVAIVHDLNDMNTPCFLPRTDSY